MRFDPATKELFTGTGILIKVLHCPRQMRWEELHPSVAGPHRNCAACDREVLDTAVMSEASIISAVRDDPSTCLRVSARQDNLTVVPLQTG